MLTTSPPLSCAKGPAADVAGDRLEDTASFPATSTVASPAHAILRMVDAGTDKNQNLHSNGPLGRRTSSLSLSPAHDSRERAAVMAQVKNQISGLECFK
jgi:hypothetical protein